MNDKKIKGLLLGLLGERIVSNHLRSIGHIVNESLYMFDKHKDIEVDGNLVEIKTQCPLMFLDSFAFNHSQLNKIRNVNRAYWVSVPLKTIYDKYEGTIFEMDPKIATHHEHKLKSGKNVICFNRKQNGIKAVYQIKYKKLLNHLRELSTSYL